MVLVVFEVWRVVVICCCIIMVVVIVFVLGVVIFLLVVVFNMFWNCLIEVEYVYFWEYVGWML